ncbi:MAG: Maf family nucleotide pyrophosphatase [Candidatus Omnitrophota bacterium]|nr:septum formation protein Maf [Candidatus Omnitrophota bacterium]MBU2257702.1 septum formation protein Maf [Candidatus Omnitrophota bacterium]
MRTIYLASGSKARKKLLESIGLKFKVIRTNVKEIRKSPVKTYPELVQANALNKALEASRRVKSGVIIGADTIVVENNQVCGKPRDLDDARRMLKRLVDKPQWVYTGLAVIDKDRNIKNVSYEKTKVFLDKLTDEEINAYFSRVSPLDKAGSFDIQGRGALFIRRIEGCFYNVVGLPLRKLYIIFKQLNIKLFLFFLPAIYCLLSTILLSGCSTEYNIATGKQESFYYSTDKEVQMGQSISRSLEEELKLADDPLLQKRVEDIGKKVVAVSDRKDIDYHFKVLDDEEVNALSLPGGFVYVNKGLVDKVSSDDELAAVLAHEVGHIVARHSIKKLQGVISYSFLRLLTVPLNDAGKVGTAADMAVTELLLGFSREDELLADQLAARYVKLAGYSPKAMINFLEKLEDINRRKPLRPKNYLKTHPYVPDRIRVVKEEMGEKIGFSDYINIQQKPHGQ